MQEDPSLHRSWRKQRATCAFAAWTLRTLASLGILTERTEKQVALTPLGEALKTGAPGSARATLIAPAGHWQWQGWPELMHSLESGETGFEKALGIPLFDYLAEHPEEASHFSDAMLGLHGAEPPAVAEAYDFLDIGLLLMWGVPQGISWRRF